MSYRKKAGTYPEDMLWCRQWLERGLRVWCIREKNGGLIYTYLAGEIGEWTMLDSRPVDEFTVQAVVKGARGAPVFGPESQWPK